MFGGRMAVYRNGIETKRKLVSEMYSDLHVKNASEIKIRDIAEKCDCSPAGVYRHFENLEYLIMVSSVMFLFDYEIEYRELLEREDDPFEIIIKSWHIFNKHCFDRPDIFYRLFWGPHHEMFEQAVRECEGLFPIEGPARNHEIFFLTLYSGDVAERDYNVLRAATKLKLISDDDARFLCDSNALILKGSLVGELEGDFESRKKAERDCNWLIERNYQNVLGDIYKSRLRPAS